jgi:protein-tyrosine phosphatase
MVDRVSSDRTVYLEGALNVRDLGGLATADGHHVAERSLFRGASPHQTTPADRAVLQGLGIRTVIDLRSPWERDLEPYEWPGVRLVSAPLVDDEVAASIHRRFADATLTNADLVDWWGLTKVPESLEAQLGSMRTIFSCFLEAGPGEATLYHCRGGKDRTGLVSVIVLGTLGVTRDEVAADFLASNRQLAPMAAEFQERMRASGIELSEAAIASLAGVKEEWLSGLYRWIDEHYGSIEGYLRHRVGLDDDDLTRLRDRYLM